MADLSKVVDYSATVPVTIFSDDGRDVIFHVRTLENKDAQALMSKRRAKALSKRASGAEDQDEYVGGLMADTIDPPAEVLATCIVSWEWNGHSFGALGDDPALTPESAAEVLGYGWIKTLVLSKAIDIGNFTTA